MFIKFIYILVLFLISMIVFSCQKNTDSITGCNEEDTTNNGGPIFRKPNIYIYPNEKIELKVQLKFPYGGKIIESTPQYLNGWNIQVEPSGVINNQYQYLFYEAQIPEILQRKSGWIIEGENLEDFFIQNLSNLLFSRKEVTDFLEYWIPLLEFDKTYIIYPHYSKELSQIIDIHFSIPPNNLIRVLYLIEEYDGINQVQIPPVPEYKREGFTVLEWGVVYQ